MIQRTQSILSGSRRCPKDRVFGVSTAKSSSISPLPFAPTVVTSLASSGIACIAQLCQRIVTASEYLDAGWLTHDIALVRENSRFGCRGGFIRRAGGYVREADPAGPVM